MPQVQLADGSMQAGVAQYRRAPHLCGDARPRLEVHLLDHTADLYGARLAVRLIAPIRPEMRFDGIEALKARIAEDIAAARQILTPQGA